MSDLIQARRRDLNRELVAQQKARHQARLADRRQRIAEMTADPSFRRPDGSVDVTAISKATGVSDPTIRNDLTALDIPIGRPTPPPRSVEGDDDDLDDEDEGVPVTLRFVSLAQLARIAREDLADAVEAVRRWRASQRCPSRLADATRAVEMYQAKHGNHVLFDGHRYYINKAGELGKYKAGRRYPYQEAN